MKLVAALSCCLLLLMVAVATADIVPTCQVQDPSGLGLTATLDTTSDPGYDIVNVFVTSLPAGTTGILSAQGELTATGGTFFVANKAATNGTFQSDTAWTGLDSPGNNGNSTYYTCWDFQTANGAAMWGRDGASTSHASATIFGGWYERRDGRLRYRGANTDPLGGATNSDGWAKNLLAQFVVTPSTTLISGNFDLTDPREVNCLGFMPSGSSLTTDFTIVSEPSQRSSCWALGCSACWLTPGVSGSS